MLAAREPSSIKITTRLVKSFVNKTRRDLGFLALFLPFATSLYPPQIKR